MFNPLSSILNAAYPLARQALFSLEPEAAHRAQAVDRFDEAERGRRRGRHGHSAGEGKWPASTRR